MDESKTDNIIDHIIDKQIHVLPCLQELKTPGAYSTGFEKEQQAGYWNGTKMEPLSNMETSDLFDTFWSRDANKNLTDVMKPGTYFTIKPSKTVPRQYTLNEINHITKDGLLNIPSFNEYKFTNGKECKDFTCQTKWSMYTQYLVGKFTGIPPSADSRQNIAFLVSHHNRMKKTDDTQGILPLLKDSGCDAYANCFTLKIRVEPKGNTRITGSGRVCGKECLKNNATYHFDVVFPGYPDKGGFSSDTKIGGGYKYCKELLDNINVDVIAEGIDTGLKKDIKPFTIYLVRHGNSMHNKPINAASGKFANQEPRLDSSLTPLGIYQAYNVGRQIYEKAEAEDKAAASSGAGAGATTGEQLSSGTEEEAPKKVTPFSNANIILCSSFLQRTQLTGLCILEGIQAAQISWAKWLKLKTAIMTQVQLLQDVLSKIEDIESVKNAYPTFTVNTASYNESSRQRIISTRTPENFDPTTRTYISGAEGLIEEAAARSERQGTGIVRKELDTDSIWRTKDELWTKDEDKNKHKINLRDTMNELMKQGGGVTFGQDTVAATAPMKWLAESSSAVENIIKAMEVNGTVENITENAAYKESMKNITDALAVLTESDFKNEYGVSDELLEKLKKALTNTRTTLIKQIGPIISPAYGRIQNPKSIIKKPGSTTDNVGKEDPANLAQLGAKRLAAELEEAGSSSGSSPSGSVAILQPSTLVGSVSSLGSSLGSSSAAISGASPVVPAPASPAAGSGTGTPAPVNTPVGSPQGSPRGSPPTVPVVVTAAIPAQVNTPQGSPPPTVPVAKVTAIPSSAVPSAISSPSSAISSALPPTSVETPSPSATPSTPSPTGSVETPVESKPARHKIEFHGKFIPGNGRGKKLVGQLTINDKSGLIGDEATVEHGTTSITSPAPEKSVIQDMFKGVPGFSFHVVEVS